VTDVGWTRGLAGLVTLGLMVGAAGCATGAPVASGVYHRAKVSAHDLAHTWPAVVAAGRRSPVDILKPSQAVTVPVGKALATVQVAFTGSHGTDTLIVRQTATGGGSVSVVAPGGQVLLHLPEEAGGFVLEYGQTHLPVLVAEASQSRCGTGGCSYQAYTWDPVAGHFIAVPANLVRAYRYLPRRRQFEPTWVSEEGAGLFGYAGPNQVGIGLGDHLYDAWQHMVLQSYAYAANGTAAGIWVRIGRPLYGPSSPRGIVSQFTSPGRVYTAFLEARALNIWPQGQALLKDAQAEAVWDRLQPLGRLGMTLMLTALNPTVSGRADRPQVVDEVVGLEGHGPATRMCAWQVTLSEQAVGSGWKVVSARLAPVRLRVSTVRAVLAAIRRDHRWRASLIRQDAPITVNQSVGLAWQVSRLVAGQPKPWLVVRAQSGRIGPAAL
jgi:hypothetical protein